VSGFNKYLFLALDIHYVQQFRPVLLLHGDVEPVAIEPPSAMKDYLHGVVDKTFVVTVDEAVGRIQGQKLIEDGSSYKLLPTWSLTTPNTKVVTVASKSSEEKVHSHGRVMADR